MNVKGVKSIKNVFNFPKSKFIVNECFSFNSLNVSYTGMDKKMFKTHKLVLSGLISSNNILHNIFKNELERIVLNKSISLVDIEGIDFYNATITTTIICNNINVNLYMLSFINKYES